MFTVGEAAKRLGITAYTLRYYEKIGLVPEPARRENSQSRLYSEADLRFIRFLLSLKETGMSLTDIAHFVQDGCLLDREASAPDEQLAGSVRQRLAILQRHLAELEAQQARLAGIAELTREKIRFYEEITNMETGACK